MKCAKCGAEMPDGASFCGVCGAPTGDGDKTEKVEAEVVENAAPRGNGAADSCRPPRREASPRPAGNIDSATYIIFAILVTLFCFMPTGIPAIVYAAKIDSAQQRGDADGAAEAARKAKMWCIISAVVAAAALIICVVVWLLIFVGVLGIAAAAGTGASMFVH